MKFISLLVIFMFSLQAYGQNKDNSNKIINADTFDVRFETTKGPFIIRTYRDWAPIGAERFYQLVKSGFYTDIAIFRVQPEYVVQFGINDDSLANQQWDDKPLADEKVLASNLKGTVAYARDGAESRTTQIFINYHDNLTLDTIMFNDLRGFPPFGEVIEGMDVVRQFYPEYGFEPAEYQDPVYHYGNAWLKTNYPELDYIIKAEILP
jgi:peptidyl-prolyl cis-trans isomerase A (cyclophilin A)